MNGESKNPKNPKKGLDEREKAFEAKYQLDEDLAFKISVRRAKLLGLWVAEIRGLTVEQATAYARLAVEADQAQPGHKGLLSKLGDDLTAGGHLLEAERLSAAFQSLEPVARQQVIDEAAAGKRATASE